MFEKVNEIICFWFGNSVEETMKMVPKWWQKNASFDEQIKEKFSSILKYARDNKLEGWRVQPKSCLAYIILHDQFPRNVFRNQSDSFFLDPKALSASEEGHAHKLDKELNLIERQFFYMPFMHSEQIENQKVSVALFKQLSDEAKKSQSPFKAQLESAYRFAIRHYEVILSFGRFPHRNKILDRLSTKEEIQFLENSDNHF